MRICIYRNTYGDEHLIKRFKEVSELMEQQLVFVMSAMNQLNRAFAEIVEQVALGSKAENELPPVEEPAKKKRGRPRKA